MDRIHTDTSTGIERVMVAPAGALRTELRVRHVACGCASAAACVTHALDRIGAITVARRAPGGAWMTREDEAKPFRIAEQAPTWDNLIPLRVLL